MSLRKDKSSEKNKAFMRLALELANQNKGLTGLNPSVGCVVTHKDEIISYGKTDINGRPHAEVVALKNNKINFKNSNMYVTLEPCIHYGKTPPCTNIIIKNKIKLVNYSIEDFDKRTAKKTKNVLENLEIAKSRYERDPNLGPISISVTPPSRPNKATMEEYAAIGVDRYIPMLASSDENTSLKYLDNLNSELF